jgi:fructose-1,6-bisphosphatase/inositol monophosphatase family enzyme
MSLPDADKVSKILIESAERFIIPRFRMLEQGQVSTKTGPNDLVTQADLDVEAHLEAILPGLLPGSVVVGEEGVSQGTASLDILHTDSAIWVVDPVDGTHNFVHGRPEFSVMLALVQNGQTKMGWIYDVLKKEMTVAEQGGGACLNGLRLKVSSETEVPDINGYLAPWLFRKEYRDKVKDAMKSLNCSWLRSASHEYLNIAKGAAEFSVSSRLKPWDHLAGSLIVTEAGGYVRTWKGEDYGPRYQQGIDDGLLVASDKKVWDIIFNQIINKIL